MTAKAAPGTRKRAAIAIGALACVVAVLVATLPPVEGLGGRVRLVVFHGASTWVNLMTFTLAGLVAIAYLASRALAAAGRLERSSDRLYSWASGLRWYSIPLWAVNSGLGVLSAYLSWGGVDFTEPRLQATVWILLGAGLVAAADMMLERPALSAALDGAFAVGLWALVVSAPNRMHPDNPVLNSPWYVLVPFFVMVASLLAIALLASWLISTRVSAASAHVTEAAA